MSCRKGTKGSKKKHAAFYINARGKMCCANHLLLEENPLAFEPARACLTDCDRCISMEESRLAVETRKENNIQDLSVDNAASLNGKTIRTTRLATVEEAKLFDLKDDGDNILIEFTDNSILVSTGVIRYKLA